MITQDKIFNKLKDKFPEHMLESIFAATENEFFPRKSYIYKENDKANKVYLILDGQVKIGMTAFNGKEKIKAIMLAGDTFGVLSLIDQHYRKNFACAMVDCEIVGIEKQKLEQILQNDPQVYIQILKKISARLIEHEEKVELWSTFSAEEKILDWLKELALGKGELNSDGQLITHLPLNHSQIAALTDTSRQTVCSVLSRFKQKKLLEVVDDKLIVYNISEL